jgi:hypothetical protein
MSNIKQDMEDGFAEFLNAQRAIPGSVCRLTLVQFDADTERRIRLDTIYASKPVAEAPYLDLEPRGWTPLYDAIGTTVIQTRERLSRLPVAEQPERVLFVIITDGQENSSREWARQQVRQQIEQAQTRDHWEFLFLGANQARLTEEAAAMNIGGQSVAAYASTPTSARNMWVGTSNAIANYRSGGSSNLTAEDRAILDADVSGTTGGASGTGGITIAP